MSISEYADGSVVLCNNETALLVMHNDDPLIFAGRTELARSFGVWGIISPAAAEVSISDPSRPDPIPAPTRLISGGIDGRDPITAAALRVFIVPVGSGPVTVTAYDALGKEIANAEIP